MRNKIYSILFICLSLQVHAQVPGYLGKRFAIGYAFTAMPFPYFSDIRNTDGTKLIISSLNTRQNIELNFVMTQKTFLMLNYSFQKWGVVSNLDDNGKLIEINPLTNNTLQKEIGVSDFKYINALSDKFTIFYSGTTAIAPRGNYSAVGLSFERIIPQVTDLNNNVTSLPSTNNYGIAFRFGKRRIFYDRLMLDLSTNIEIGAGIFVPAGTYNESGRKFDINDSYESNAPTLKMDDLNTKARKQASYYSIFSIRFGIYYLL